LIKLCWAKKQMNCGEQWMRQRWREDTNQDERSWAPQIEASKFVALGTRQTPDHSHFKAI